MWAACLSSNRNAGERRLNVHPKPLAPPRRGRGTGTTAAVARRGVVSQPSLWAQPVPGWDARSGQNRLRPL